MLNVYTFNVTLTSHVDRRRSMKTTVTVDGTCLSHAWDKCERQCAQEYPNEKAEITAGNRQPEHLRPAVRELQELQA